MLIFDLYKYLRPGHMLNVDLYKGGVGAEAEENFKPRCGGAGYIVAHGQKTTTHADLKFETLIMILIIINYFKVKR